MATGYDFSKFSLTKQIKKSRGTLLDMADKYTATTAPVNRVAEFTGANFAKPSLFKPTAKIQQTPQAAGGIPGGDYGPVGGSGGQYIMDQQPGAGEPPLTTDGGGAVADPTNWTSQWTGGYDPSTATGFATEQEKSLMDPSTRKRLDELFAEWDKWYTKIHTLPEGEDEPGDWDDNQNKAEAAYNAFIAEWRDNYAVSASGNEYTGNIQWLVDNWKDQWGQDESIIKPFESEWTSIFGDVFGDMQGLPSSTDFLKTFLTNFGIDKIASGEIKPGDYGYDKWSPEAFQKLIEGGAGIPGFDWKEGDPNVSEEQNFIKYLMDTAKELSAGLADKFQLMLDQGLLGEARAKEFKAITDLLYSPGMTKEERDTLVAAEMAPYIEEENRKLLESKRNIGLRLIGASTGQRNEERKSNTALLMAKSTITGQLLAQDIKMRSDNYNLATQALGKFKNDEIGAILQAAGLDNERYGQVLGFLADVGRTALGSKETEYGYYTDRLKLAQDFYLEDASRRLQETLGTVGLELNKYNIDTQAGLDEMKTAYQTALANRGMNIDEAAKNAEIMIEQYRTALSFGQMDLNKMATLAELAAKAHDGDRQAYGLYNSMILEEQLKNRGMNIEQAGMLSDLSMTMWTTDRQTALTQWVEKYRAKLTMWLAEFEANNQQDTGGGFFPTLFKLAGGAVSVYNAIKSRNPGGGGTPGGGGGPVPDNPPGVGGGIG